MKFIVDAQLPRKLSDFLKVKGFDSIHTLDLPQKNRTKDETIAKIANDKDRVVVSKDGDFLESQMVKNEPRKLILVRTGNLPNKELINIFDKNLDTIVRMISSSNLVEVSKTEIAEHGI